MININDQVRQFMITYIPYKQMYVVMININVDDRQFITTYIPHILMYVVMIKISMKIYFLLNTVHLCDDKHKSKMNVHDSILTT